MKEWIKPILLMSLLGVLIVGGIVLVLSWASGGSRKEAASELESASMPSESSTAETDSRRRSFPQEGTGAQAGAQASDAPESRGARQEMAFNNSASSSGQQSGGPGMMPEGGPPPGGEGGRPPQGMSPGDSPDSGSKNTSSSKSSSDSSKGPPRRSMKDRVEKTSPEDRALEIQFRMEEGAYRASHR